MFRFFAPLLAAITGASPALSACPTANDLQSGIVFTLSDGTQEVFRRVGSHEIEAIWTDRAGLATRNVLAKGIYLVDAGDVVNGEVQSEGRSITTFPVSNAKLPDPVPGTEWTVEVIAKEDDGPISSEERYEFGQQQTFAIGACTFTAVPITLTYLNLSKGNFDEYIWLDELNLSIVIKESFGEGDSDSYTYTRVEPVAK